MQGYGDSPMFSVVWEKEEVMGEEDAAELEGEGGGGRGGQASGSERPKRAVQVQPKKVHQTVPMDTYITFPFALLATLLQWSNNWMLPQNPSYFTLRTIQGNARGRIHDYDAVLSGDEAPDSNLVQVVNDMKALANLLAPPMMMPSTFAGLHCEKTEDEVDLLVAKDIEEFNDAEKARHENGDFKKAPHEWPSRTFLDAFDKWFTTDGNWRSAQGEQRALGFPFTDRLQRDPPAPPGHCWMGPFWVKQEMHQTALRIGNDICKAMEEGILKLPWEAWEPQGSGKKGGPGCKAGGAAGEKKKQKKKK